MRKTGQTVSDLLSLIEFASSKASRECEEVDVKVVEKGSM